MPARASDARQRGPLELRVRAGARDGADVGERRDPGGARAARRAPRWGGWSGRWRARARGPIRARGAQLPRRAGHAPPRTCRRGAAPATRPHAPTGPLTSARLWRKYAGDADSQADGRPQEVAAGTEVHAVGRRRWRPRRRTAAWCSGRAVERADRARGGAHGLGGPAAARRRATASSSPELSGKRLGLSHLCEALETSGIVPDEVRAAIGRLVDAGIVEPVPLASQQPPRSSRSATDAFLPLQPRRPAADASPSRGATPSAPRAASSRRAAAPSTRASGASRVAASAGARAR